MELEGIMLSEISQTEKDKHYMTSLTCEEEQKQNKNQDQTPRKRDQTLITIGGGYGEGELEEGGQNVQTSSYKINKY